MRVVGGAFMVLWVFLLGTGIEKGCNMCGVAGY